VVAEGIETQEQLQFLRLLRCEEGQGFLLGRPAEPGKLNWAKLIGTRKQNMISSSWSANLPMAVNE